MKSKFEADSNFVLSSTITEIKASNKSYYNILPVVKNIIRQSLNELGNVDFPDKTNTTIEYRAKIKRNDSVLTLTQYFNGTLTLQGKPNRLFDDCCVHIEKIKSIDDKSLGILDVNPSMKLIGMAEKDVKDKIDPIEINTLELEMIKFGNYWQKDHDKIDKSNLENFINAFYWVNGYLYKYENILHIAEKIYKITPNFLDKITVEVLGEVSVVSIE
ncbi:MAG: hypothetical protein Q8M95_04705 [Candidatus Methanoperedens sp.]|nr:hypothetical protein [Candidatus Methanoperedens sp.]